LNVKPLGGLKSSWDGAEETISLTATVWVTGVPPKSIAESVTVAL